MVKSPEVPHGGVLAVSVPGSLEAALLQVGRMEMLGTPTVHPKGKLFSLPATTYTKNI